MSKFRVEDRGRIDRDRPVTFTFDGETYDGYEGDTVASALLANGVHLMGRGFKYHRPRGPLTAGSEEPNALIGTSRGPGRFEPNTRATVQEIHGGLNAESQNRWPSLKFDVGAINDRLYMLFSAGFYYKTFMWPKSFWDRVYEPFIRRAAGLGRAPTEIDPDNYASRHLHCDVLIVGAGPAGLAAALTAGRTGGDVVLVDENSEAGGTLLSEPSVNIDGAAAWDWLAATLAELEALPNVRILTRTTAIGYYHQNMVGLCQKLTDHLTSPPQNAPRERLWRVRAGQVILAQGAIERPLVFDGNDRPGVMLAGAAQTYLNRFGVKVGNRPAILTSHDSAWYAAFDLADAGVGVAAIIDTRAYIDDALAEGARTRGIEVLTGHTATATAGRLRITNRPRQPDAQRQARPLAPDHLRRAPDVRRLDALAAPLLAHQRHAPLGCRGGGLPSRRPRRGLPHRRRRTRSLGRRPRARGRRQGRRRRRPRPRPCRRAGRVRRHRRPPGHAAFSTRNFPPTAARAAPRPSSTSRTTSPPRTSASPCARACAPSSTSSATPPTAWRPTRARCRT